MSVMYLVTTKTITRICWIAINLSCFAIALKDVHVTVPAAVRRGGNASLTCRYDLEQDKLYSIKWYKGRREFYRYTPRESPPMKVFAAAGIVVERSMSNASSVMLTSVELAISGKYSCEVSAEAPSFHTVIVSGDLEVVDFPDSGPSIEGADKIYSIGDILTANCTLNKTKPPANLTWLINSFPVPPHQLTSYRASRDELSNLETAVLGLKLVLTPKHFRSKSLRIACKAQIYDIYEKFTEKLVELDASTNLILIDDLSTIGESKHQLYDTKDEQNNLQMQHIQARKLATHPTRTTGSFCMYSDQLFVTSPTSSVFWMMQPSGGVFLEVNKRMSQSSSSLSEQLEDEEVQEILKTGTDLRQYSQQIEKEFKEVENKSIEDYIKESQNIASLHNQIGECDEILERMESMLMNFQNVLSNISSEITTLQKKSVCMSVQLTNRQSVRAQLSQFIEDMAVPEEMISTIMETPVTEKEFQTQLGALNHKLNLIKELSFRDSKSAADVSDVLNKLKIKAMAKIRTYLLEQTYKFRKPMTNYQVPQNAMLKHKFFFEFILSNERQVAQEICNEYVDTMSKIYYSYFKSYSSRLSALQYEESVSKDDLMGIEDTASRGIFSKTTSLKNKSTIFTIGNRGDILNQQLEAPIIVPHAQVKNRYTFEALFRSEQYALVDNACREYLFLTEFFMVRGAQAQDLFNQIMGKTLTLMIKNLETHIQDCYDTIAMFLCIQLIFRYQLMCHKRCVPALDKYWDSLQTVIWPRFEHAFRVNIQSIRDCDPTKFHKELGPHYITRRYAEFSAAIVGISEQFPNELVSRLLLELQNEVECFILRMAAIFTSRKEQLIYLINNYDLVLGVLMEHTRDNSKEAEAFREQLSARSAEYVDEILAPHFGGIIQFVKECEPLLEKEQLDELKRQERRSLALVASFSANWKNSLLELNREVLLSFPSLLTGNTLLQLALASLVQYYHRFHKLLTPNARAQLTNIHVIMVEIKKYKNNY